MKITKYISFGFFSCLALASCESEEVQDPAINVQFPEALKHTMTSDDSIADTIAITFDVPVKWDLTSSASEWLRFVDGTSTHPSLAGQAGKHSVEVVIAPNEGFNADSASVTLAVAGQQQVVATIYRGQVTPKLSFSLVNTDSGVVTPLEKPEVSLDWNATNFRYSAQIKVEANYDWELEAIPAWISRENLVQEGAEGNIVTLSFNADYTGYTAEDMTADLVFKHQRNENVQQTLKLQTETLVGKIRIADSETEYFNGLTVDNQGHLVYEEDTTSVFDLNILAGEPIHFLKYEGSIWDNKFYFGTTSDMGEQQYPEAYWVTIEEDAENAHETYSSSAYMYKNLLSFGANDGKERIAGLLAIPQSIYDVHGENIEDYVDFEGAVKPELVEAGCYVTHLTQTGATGQGGLSFLFPSELASIRPMTEEDGEFFYFIQYELGVPQTGINQLTYTTPAASESALIATPGAVSGFVPNPEHNWIAVEVMPDFEGQGPACVIMIIRENLPADAAYPIQGQVVLRDQSGINKYGINVVLERSL